MRRRRRHQVQDGTEVALANFALTFAKALLVLCVALFLLINPNKGADGTKPKAEYLISVEWSSNGRYDVDSWTKGPDGKRVSFNNKEAGIIFLERDDLGNDCDATTVGGKSAGVCEEITVIRGLVSGEYQFALHLYSANNVAKAESCPPVTARVKIEKLNPTTQIVFQRSVILDRVRQEFPVVRFTTEADGTLDQFVSADLEPIVYGGETP